MTDRRLTPANGRVAALHLAGKVPAERYLAGALMMLTCPVSDLCAEPGGARDRQLLLGAIVTVFEDRDNWSFVQAADGYVGYVASDRLGPVRDVTHMVGTAATHAYLAEDIKSPDVMCLPFGARVSVLDERAKFFETTLGFIPKKHLRPLDRPFTDPATVAQLHFGVPYLWGGNSTRGIDCSGLVAAALTACGIPSPADSDLQCEGLGADFTGTARRGDLIFWRGHVAMMVDEATLIHANAHHMATAYEPLEAATLRIAAQDGGPVTARRRI
ncbi:MULTISPECIES: NlpC/P60 family protein [unclassified Yoonia]|uniref:C40 family peptidase n=1 Tax=unclassified Yoonia TaxID=2629118 RepID=UPI002AFF03B1|nr:MULTISPECIES: NlpC/P60 family protein [unclassified Yoonia]